MKNVLTNEDLHFLALGASLLGSGGGGDPSFDLLAAHELCLHQGPVSLYQIDEIPDEEIVVCCAYIGAPLVASEKLSTIGEWKKAQILIERFLDRPLWGVVSGEIGGANAFAALIAALECNLKLIDADTLGRAFPTVNISSCALHSIKPTPAVLVDGLLNGAVLDCKETQVLEHFARSLVVPMGSTAAMMLYPMTGRQAKVALIPGSLGSALALGKVLERDRALPGKVVGRGMIIDQMIRIEGGFQKGEILIQENDSEQVYIIDVQNEYLVVRRGEEVLSTTPDIISLINQETRTPILSDQIKYGQQVEILVMASPKIWTSQCGLEMTSPRAFGYTFEPKLIKED